MRFDFSRGGKVTIYAGFPEGMQLKGRKPGQWPELSLAMAREMKVIVDDGTQYPDWNNRGDIKAKLKVDRILLLHRYGFPPVANNEAYKSVPEQVENFKKYQ